MYIPIKSVSTTNQIPFNVALFIGCLFALTVCNHISSILIEWVYKLNIDHLTLSSSTSAARILSAVLIAPLVEELVFRIHLSGKTKHVWSLALMFLAPVFVLDIGSPVVKMILFMLIVPSTVYFLTKPRIVYFIQRKYYKVTFWVSVILFSSLHFSAINSSGVPVFSTILILIFIFIPISYTFAYVRIKFGLICVIIFHSLHNFVSILLNTYL